MLLTISTTHRPATDLGICCTRTRPARRPSSSPSAAPRLLPGSYAPALHHRHTTALLLDIDPLKLVRGPGTVLTDYVNDRPYFSSSLLSVAMARVFGTAMSGRAKQRQELAETPIRLKAALTAVPCRGAGTPSSRTGSGRSATRSRPRPTRRRSVPYHNVRLRATKTLAELLNHVYVLLPVADNRKHCLLDRRGRGRHAGRLAATRAPDLPDRDRRHRVGSQAVRIGV